MLKLSANVRVSAERSEAQFELAGAEVRLGRIGKDKAFAITEIKSQMGAFLYRMGENLIERGQRITVKADNIGGFKIGDQIAAIPFWRK